MTYRFTRLIGMMSFAMAFIVAALIGAAVVSSASAQESGGRTALIIIDVQEFYFEGGAMPLVDPEAASGNCKKLIEKFRADGRMIVHVAHNAKAGAAFHPDVEPLDGEKVFVKDEVNAFNGTGLLDYLRKNRVDNLVICGMQTHMCVEGAVRAAHDLGFQCTLIGDACATRALTYGEHKVSAEDVHSSTLSTLDRVYATVMDTRTFIGSD